MSIKSSLPNICKSKSRIFIVACFIVYTMFFLLGELFSFGSMVPSGKESLHGWMLRLARDASLACGLAGLIMLGIRNLRREGISIKRITVPLAAILVCVGWAVLGWCGFRTCEKWSKAFEVHEQHVTQLEEALVECRGDPTKYAESRLIAKLLFEENGAISQYTTADGQVVLYEPTDEDHEFVELKSESKLLLQHAQKAMRTAMYGWIALALMSILAGLVTPIHKARNDGRDAVLD